MKRIFILLFLLPVIYFGQIQWNGKIGMSITVPENKIEFNYPSTNELIFKIDNKGKLWINPKFKKYKKQIEKWIREQKQKESSIIFKWVIV